MAGLSLLHHQLYPASTAGAAAPSKRFMPSVKVITKYAYDTMPREPVGFS